MMACFMCHTDHDPDETACPAVPPENSIEPFTSHPFPAKYAGRCIKCEWAVSEGEIIILTQDGVYHKECE